MKINLMENFNERKLKLIIKLPVNEKGRFKLQSRGNISGRQYKTVNGLLGRLSNDVLRRGLREKRWTNFLSLKEDKNEL